MSRLMRILGVLLAAWAAGLAGAPAAAGDAQPLDSGWQWPVTPPRIVAAFIAPAHEYGPGHRGIDLAAAYGTPVRSPAAGVVAFAGTVAGRPLVTIDHGSQLVTTLEPVRPAVPVGAYVRAGQIVGQVDAGGHTAADSVHFGVRENGEYINPLLLLGGVDRAILLPCC